MSPSAERLRHVVETLSQLELSAVVAFVLGLREQVERDVGVLRGELAVAVLGLPAHFVHALLRAAQALRDWLS